MLERILGLLTRSAVIALMIVLIVALLSTKAPILLGHAFLIFNLPHIIRYGSGRSRRGWRATIGVIMSPPPCRSGPAWFVV
jgi:putative oxidoreductase